MIQYIFIFAYVFVLNIIVILRQLLLIPPVIHYVRTGGAMADHLDSQPFTVNMITIDVRKMDFFFCDCVRVYHARNKATGQVRTFRRLEIVNVDGKQLVTY